MPPKINPLGLNALQLKTLTLLQALARLPDHAESLADGAIRVSRLPRPHGDHFHLGNAVVAARDATGLANPSAWAALERRGLIRSEFPLAAVLTADGLNYDTGTTRQILHGADH